MRTMLWTIPVRKQRRKKGEKSGEKEHKGQYAPIFREVRRWCKNGRIKNGEGMEKYEDRKNYNFSSLC